MFRRRIPDGHGCRFIELSNLVDGELTAEKHEAIENHLLGCEECRLTVVRFRSLDELVRKTTGAEVEVPYRVTAAIVDDVEKRSPFLTRALLRVGVGLGAVGSVGVAAVLIGGILSPTSTGNGGGHQRATRNTHAATTFRHLAPGSRMAEPLILVQNGALLRGALQQSKPDRSHSRKSAKGNR